MVFHTNNKFKVPELVKRYLVQTGLIPEIKNNEGGYYVGRFDDGKYFDLGDPIHEGY